MASPILIASTGRADWGLLSPLAEELRRRGDTPLIAAGNMHLLEEMGETWREIEGDGFEIAARMPARGNASEIFSQTAEGFSKALRSISPRCVVALGDRSEMLAVASIAAIEGVPVVHIAGGAISEGAIDDAMRHAITQLSQLHLVETEDYRRRVIQMGQQPETVINTGAIGAWSASAIKKMSISDIADSLEFTPDKDTLLVTLHAATRSSISPEKQYRELLAALETRIATNRIIFTYPNNDVDPAPVIAMLHDFASRHPERAILVPSLGRIRYHSLLPHIAAVVGNSSSGIVEVPSAGIPTLDIGIRQQGRTTAISTLHCGDDASAIAEGLKKVLSPEFQALAADAKNPYFNPRTPQIMAEAILTTDFKPFPQKKFYDIR